MGGSTIYVSAEHSICLFCLLPRTFGSFTDKGAYRGRENVHMGRNVFAEI